MGISECLVLISSYQMFWYRVPIFRFRSIETHIRFFPLDEWCAHLTQTQRWRQLFANDSPQLATTNWIVLFVTLHAIVTNAHPIFIWKTIFLSLNYVTKLLSIAFNSNFNILFFFFSLYLQALVGSIKLLAVTCLRKLFLFIVVCKMKTTFGNEAEKKKLNK